MKLDKRVLDAMKAKPGQSAQKLAEGLGMDVAYVETALRDAEADCKAIDLSSHGWYPPRPRRRRR